MNLVCVSVTGSEEKRFRFAHYLLNQDIEQLLNICAPGWDTPPTTSSSPSPPAKDLLEKLRLLLKSQVEAHLCVSVLLCAQVVFPEIPIHCISHPVSTPLPFHCLPVLSHQIPFLED